MDDFFATIVIFVLAILIFIIGFTVGELTAESSTRAEAIKHGYAHYQVDENAKATFVWNNDEKK